MTDYIETKLNPKTNEYDWRPMDFELHTVAEFTALTGKYGFKLQDHPHSVIVAPRILESLSVESIAFVSGTTWRYTFVTVDLSSVSVGDFLHVKTTTAAANSGRFAITAKGADYVDVVNADGVAQASVAGTAAISGQPLSEVDSNTPLVTQYSPDYRKGTARVFMHIGNVGTRYVVFYEGGGTVLGLDQWEDLIQQIIDGMTIIGQGGGGLLNFVTNPDTESDTVSVSSWGVSSGADITIDRVIDSRVLDGDASIYLEGGGSVVTDDYAYAECSAIPRAYRNRSLQIEFEYETQVDYENDGDVEVVIFDGTNVIVPNISAIPLGKGTFRAVFDSSDSSDPYQVWFRSGIAGDPWAIVIDNLRVGPMYVMTGPAVTEPTSCTITGSWVANTTYSGMIARNSQYADIEFLIKLTGAPTAANLTLTLPNGLQVDEDALTGTGSDSIALGYAQMEGNSAGSGGQAVVYYTKGGTSTQVKLGIAQSGSRFMFNPVTATAPFTFGNTDFIVGKFRVPIANWDANVQFAQSSSEYVSNSSVTDANDSAAYESGPRGSLVPSVSGGHYYKEVRLSRGYKHVWLEFQDAGSGNFIEVGSTPFARQEHFGTARYGALMIRQSDTLYRVYFCAGGYAQASNGSAVSWATAAAAGVRWRVSASDNPLAVETSGKVVQVRYAEIKTSGTFASAQIPFDDTIPQNTEGGELLTLSVTPRYANSYLYVEAVAYVGEESNVSGAAAAALFRDSTADALCVDFCLPDFSNNVFSGGITFAPLRLAARIPSADTVSTTLSLRIGLDQSATIRYNGMSGSRRFGGVLTSFLKITEVLE